MSDKISKKRIAGIFIFMTGLYSVSFFQRVAVPGTIFNDLQKTFATTAGAITMLSSIYLFIYAGQQFFIGMLTDKFGGIKVTLVSGFILCVGVALFPFSENLTMLYLTRGLVGLGAGGMYLSGIKEIDKLFKSENFAMMVSFFCVLGYGGGLLGTRPFRGLVDWLGWRYALEIVSGFAVVMLVMLFVVSRGVHHPKSAGEGDSIWKNMWKVLGNPKIYPLVVAGMINFSLYFSIQSTIGVKFLQDFLGLAARKATQYTFVMMLTTLATMLVSGYLTRLVGNKRKPFIVFASINTMCATSMLVLGTIGLLPSFCFMIAYPMLAISAGLTPVTVSFVKELNRKEVAGMAVGTQNTATYISVAVAAGVIGIILDLFRHSVTLTSAGGKIYPASAYLTIFIVMLIFTVFSVTAAFKTQETNGTNIFDNAER